MRELLSTHLTDATIIASFGGETFARGSMYAAAGRVSTVIVSEQDRYVTAIVQGTRAAPYRTIVQLVGPWTALRIKGMCTCPVSIGCKHAAAALLVARGSAPRAEATPRAASWEGALTAVMNAQASEQQAAGVPLGLQFEVVVPPRTRGYPQGAPSPPVGPVRVRIRPVVPGRSGAWVRTGASWRDLTYDGWNPRVRSHREALQRMYAAFQARQAGYQYGEPAVHLDDLGPAGWPLLADAAEVGVAFVQLRPTWGPVVLADSPATLALDLTRSADASVASLAAVVTVRGEPMPVAAVDLVGQPPHGLLLDLSLLDEARPGLLLAPLAEPPSQAVGRLIATGEPLEIPDADLARFLRDFYPVLRQSITVVSSDDSVDLPTIEPPRLGLTVTYLPRHRVDLAWSFVYPSAGTTTRVDLTDSGASGMRDPRAERQLLSDLRIPDHGLRLFHIGPTGSRGLVASLRLGGLDAVTFTNDVLPALEAADVDVEIVGTAPDYRESESAPLVKVSVSEPTGNADWFDLGVTVSMDGEEIPFQELFSALALGETHLILDSGTFFTIERPEYDELRRLIDEAKGLQDKPSDGLRVSPYQASLWADLVKLGVVDEQSERWAGIVKGLLDLDSVPQPDLPAGLRAELRAYQRDGFSWLTFLRDNGLGGILADDMGLGKTLQALALICRVVEQQPDEAPFLVVAPTSVVHNWESEAAHFAPGLNVVCITETASRGGTRLAERVAGAQVVVTSYALFRIDYDGYDVLPWGGLVLDEAQYVKNHQAKTYQCVRRLRAPFKLAITGTPLENSLMDLWSLLSIVAPGLFPSPQGFTEHYRKPIEKGTDPELLATLRRRIRPLMLRRTKEQVATELPPKQEQVLEVTLHPRHHKIYQTHLQRERQKVLGLIGDMNKNRFEIFRSLTLLRQLSLAPSLVDPAYADVKSSKVEAFLEQIEEVVREGHRALVFSQFTGFLRLVRDRLDAEGIRYCYLDGRTRKRADQINAFKDGDAPIFLISLKAGGFGLNLTEADYVFVLDPWWNPAVEAQAVDRTHRIGQAKTVMVYRLVAAETIEEKVMELKARKQDLFDKVMDDDALLSAPLTADDIKGLFGL